MRASPRSSASWALTGRDWADAAPSTRTAVSRTDRMLKGRGLDLPASSVAVLRMGNMHTSRCTAKDLVAEGTEAVSRLPATSNGSQYMSATMLVRFAGMPGWLVAGADAQQRLRRRGRARQVDLSSTGGSRQQVTLAEAHSFFHQPGALVLVLDALGDERHLDASGEQGDGLDEVFVFRDRPDTAGEPR